jgi:tetratricopeptide (TPR) repeat protein
MMLALAAIWKALHEPERRCWWLAAASLASGLAVGARPSLLFGAVILLMPVAQAWRERRRVWTLLIAAIGPIALCGLGLMLYNTRRFDSPFELALQIEPDSADTHYNFGAALLQQGKTLEATTQLEEALRINPNDAQAHYALAVALEKTGKPEDAIAHYEQALRIKPDFVEARNRLARLLATR